MSKLRHFSKDLRGAIRAQMSREFHGSGKPDDNPDLRKQWEERYLALWAKAGFSERTAADLRGLKVEDDDDRLTVRLIGPLDSWFGVDYTDIVAALDDAKPRQLTLLIDSPGGFVGDGFGLYGELMRLIEGGCDVTTESTGLVASAAVLPFLAAQKRRMREGCTGMVHQVWGGAFLLGNAKEMRDQFDKVVKPMDKLDEAYRDVIAKRTGQSRAKAWSALEAETWYSADEFKREGYATEVASGTPESDADDGIEAQARNALLASAIARGGFQHNGG